MKIDVEGFELRVLRSAEKLFRENRIHHLIFEYTAWWTDRSPQHDLLPFVKNSLRAKWLFALDRTRETVYGPLNEEILNRFQLRYNIFKFFHVLHKYTSLNEGSEFV